MSSGIWHGIIPPAVGSGFCARCGQWMTPGTLPACGCGCAPLSEPVSVPSVTLTTIPDRADEIEALRAENEALRNRIKALERQLGRSV